MFGHRGVPNRVVPVGQPGNLRFAAIAAAVCALASQSALAQQAIWIGPVNGSWFTAGNWSTGQVPGASTSVAMQSGQPAINGNGAQAAALSVSGNTVLTISSANVGALNNITVVGEGPSSTHTSSLTGINFTGASSAGNVTINATGSGLSKFIDAAVDFRNTSTASNAVLTGANGIQFSFFDTSSAGQATITNNDNSLTAFANNASAGTAHITNNTGGLTGFFGTPTADTATIINNAGGAVDISQRSQGLGIGSLSGAGNVYLGGSDLSLGNLAQNDVITGTIADGISPQLASYGAFKGTGYPSPAGGSLTKVGTGTLTLSGQNTYTSGTSFNGGIVQVSADANLGAATGALSFNGGSLRTTADITMDRATTISAGGGTVDTMSGTQLTQNGTIIGSGALTKAGGGALILTGDNGYAGGTTISTGTLQLGNGGASGSILGDVADNGTLAFDRSDVVTFAGQVSGSGAVQQNGVGTTVLTGDNTYMGGTTISAGTLQAGNGATSGAILGNVTDNAVLAFNRSDAATFSGVVSGTGAVNQIGSGTTILTGENTYTGGTTISAGTLQLGDGGTSGSIVGNATDNAALAFNRSDAATFSGAVSGTGTVSQIGSGTTILTGENTYTGGTTVSAGTLELGDGGTSGSIMGNVTDNATLAFNRSDVTQFDGVVSGTGTAHQMGTGTTVLTGNNTYTGGTLISAGTLQLGNGATSGAILGNVTDNGTLAFDRSDPATFAGAISGTGAVNQIGSGTTILTGASTYTGGTAIGAGTLQLGDGGTSGAIVGNVTDSAALAFNRSDAATFAGAVSGTGAVSQVGSGTTILTGASTYTGGTTISAGTLQLGDGGTSGSILGNVTDNAALAFNRSDVTQFDGVVSGTGTVHQTGTGTTVLTGNNTYAGGTLISAGTLQLGNGATSGAIVGDVADNGNLTFDRSDVSVFGGLVSGTGSLTQAGTGTTILNAANSYAGGTSVAAGTLAVGDAGHPVATVGPGMTTVNAGATLGGYGSVLGSVNNSGAVAVANALPAFASGSTGTFRVAGDLSNAGLANVAAASGQIGNVLNVGGNYAGLNGQLALNTLLNEGGAASRSDRLVVGENTSGNTAIRVNQSGAGALTVADGIQLVQVNGNSAANSFHLSGPVQAGAYQYLLYQGGAKNANDWYLRSQLEATAPPATPTNVPTPTTPAAPVAYRPATVGYSVTPLLNVDYGFTVLGRLHERVGDVANLESAQPGNSNGVWGRIGGQNLDANAGDRFSTDERTFFAQFGKDWTLSRGTNGGSTHAGATLTFGSTSASFNDGMRSINGQLSNSTGTVETQAQSLGGYWTKYLPDGTYFDGVGQLTHYQNRYGDIYGDNGSQNGFGAGASGEIGKPFALGSTRIAIEPQAQLLYQYLHLNDFDDGISPIGANSTNALRGRLGFRLFRANLDNDSKTSAATPYFTADVLHDFFSPGQTSVGGTSFQNELGKTWYDLGLGITGSFGKSSELYANVKYSRSIGGDYRRAVFGQAGYRFSW